MGPPSWPTDVAVVARSTFDWVKRPRVRLTLIGALLLVIGGLVLSSSVWTLPLVIVGALMVAIAWIGHRLDGRFVIEWGDAGTELAFRATVRAAHAALEAPPRESSLPPRPGLERRSEPEPAQVIEGEAHTVEIDVAQLNALIAAAEGHEPGDGVMDGSAPDIQIRRMAPAGARAPAAPR